MHHHHPQQLDDALLMDFKEIITRELVKFLRYRTSGIATHTIFPLNIEYLCDCFDRYCALLHGLIPYFPTPGSLLFAAAFSADYLP